MISSSTLLGAIRQRPLLFNGITGGVLCAISDALAQQYEHTSSSSANGNQREQQEQEQYNYYVQQAATKLDDDDNNDVVVAVIAQHDDDNVAVDQMDQQESQSQSQHYQHQQLQQLHHSTTTLDTRRVMCAGLIGIFFGGIVYPQAYKVLDTIWKGSSFKTLVKKSLFEIATVGILVNSTSMTSRGLFQNDKHYMHVLQHVKKELPTVTRNDIFVWLPYNMIAFSIIPVIIRPTTTALMEASWQCYISLRSHDYDNNSSAPHNHRNDNNNSEQQRQKKGGLLKC